MTELFCVKDTAVSPPFVLQVFAVGLLQTSGILGAAGGSKGCMTPSPMSSGSFHGVEGMRDEQRMPCGWDEQRPGGLEWKDCSLWSSGH